jgi:hypothetical protein
LTHVVIGKKAEEPKEKQRWEPEKKRYETWQ